MKEIKAFVHRGRVAAIVQALEHLGHKRLTVIDVRGLLQAINPGEHDYSVQIGERVTNEVRLELVCAESEVAAAVNAIRSKGFTGQTVSGWVYLTTIDDAWPIDGQQSTPTTPA